ncbi:N-acetylglucosaminyltransferase [Microbulbifer sp. SAOS-129_SWC]|uniref:N-acetylglucosaminyltransferase n=1 Tax=Microbulbifer sp. SAOS-129_SWC TaxID=3145235 RepID=UPI003216F422
MLLALWLGGCVTTPAPVPRAVPLPKPQKPAGPTPEEVRQRNIAFLLGRAEQAQQRGHLTQPAGASAYDYYLRVRQLDSDNRRARSGIQSIVIELVARARDALRRRAFGEVNGYLRSAEALAPGSPLVAEVRKQLARERSRAGSQVPSGDEVPLPAGPLASRAESVVQLLRGAAERIRVDGLRVIIVARNDAEGRWVYQQLRDAVMGYRVRGDIRIGSPPRLILMQPTGGN